MATLYTRRALSAAFIVISIGGSSSLIAAEGLQIGLSGSVIAGASSEGDAHLGDILAGGHDPNRNGFSISNVELSIGGAVDPFFDAQVNLAMSVDTEGETIIELEEAYGLTRALPLGLQIKAGQFYTEFGRHNTSHPHSWAFVDQPVIASRLLGADGLRSQGARLSWLTPLPWYAEFFGAIQNASGETTTSFISSGSGHSHGEETTEAPSFAEYPLVERRVNGPEDFLYAARWLNGFDLSDTLSTNIGLSALFGPNNTGQETQTQVYGADVYIKWQSAISNKGFPFLAWHSEFMTRHYSAGDESLAEHSVLSDSGLFSYIQWGFRPGWILGVRYEIANGNESHLHDETAPEEEEHDPLRELRQRISLSLSYYPSEFSKLRLQYNHDNAENLDTGAHSVWLQLEYNIGAHMAHKF